VDVSQTLLLRELLSTSGWVDRTRQFARAMRRSTVEPGGLLLVGTPDDEPWHLTAHLDDEARFAGIPELKPTLVRYAPPPDAPPHLSVTLARLEAARRGETLLVVAEHAAPAALLERAWDARKLGATILSIDGGDQELGSVVHERLSVEDPSPTTDPGTEADLLRGFALTDSGLAVPVVSLDTVQHLVSVAVGESAPASGARRSFRDRLARLLDTISGPAGDHDH
jgi:hypothetical protein